MNSFSLQFFVATLCVGKQRISSVDDDIAFFEQRRELTDHSVHGAAGFDHHHRNTRFLERRDEFFHRARWLNVFSLGASGSEFLGNFGGAIKHGDRKSLRFHVEDEIFAHHSQADQANITLIGCHFSIFFVVSF